MNKASEGLKEVVNPNYQTENLEKKARHTDTIENKSALADKYVDMKRYREAIDLYEACLYGFNENDPTIFRKLVYVNFLFGEYQKAVDYGFKLAGNPEWDKSEEKIAFAWSFYELNEQALARQTFEEMNAEFSNYRHRLEYSKYLNKIGNKAAAVAKLNELIKEYENMGSPSRHLNKDVNRDIKAFFTEINNG
ncbi:MAG: hypothetical protein JKX73_03335 [Flavobacteriales bacterium]|nr:hypothetical protein [Flavobacteriales bacterium]